MDYKTIISLIAVILTIAGYAPYIRDILNKKTKPHSFMWFVWSLAGGVGYGLQVVGGAGVGSWVLLVAVICCFIIFLLSLREKDKDITPSDVIFLILAILSLVLWLVVKQPVWSVILATATEILGFGPTIRKSWNKPYSETLFTYQISFFRQMLLIFALQQFNILTVLYPLAWTVTNFCFSAFLIVRRRQINKQ